MWQPTHIQVTVQRAKGLLTKGKNGTNNCFVTIALGKEKYQTSIKDKSEQNVDWHEECELKIPDQGNRAELVLTCLHHNNLGIDEFLGQVTLPLNEMDVYDRPRSKWFRLESKPGKEKKNKERGELEVRISFVVKSGSLTDLSKKEKHKSSIGQLATSVGGSLLSIGTIEKRKGIKKFAKSLGSKMHLHSKKKNKDGDDLSISGSFASIGTPNSSSGGGGGPTSNGSGRRFGQRAGEADPGVISEDEDEFVFDNLSHKSSGSSLNIARQHNTTAATMNNGLQAPSLNHVPRNPSPLLGSGIIKIGGKKMPPARHLSHDDGHDGDGVGMRDEDRIIDPELEAIENDFSVRSRTLPPPSKPPRTPLFGKADGAMPAAPVAEANNVALLSAASPPKDEWETKLYGKHLETGKSDSLKRRSWEPVPLPTAAETDEKNEQSETESTENEKNKRGAGGPMATETPTSTSSSSSESEGEVEEVPNPLATAEPPLRDTPKDPSSPSPAASLSAPKVSPSSQFNLLSPADAANDFQQFNASFAKYEQQNKAKIFDSQAAKLTSRSFIAEEARVGAPQQPPQALPRASRDQESAAKAEADAEAERARQRQLEEEEAALRRAEEDARLEEELRLNEQRLREEEAAMQAERHQKRQDEEEELERQRQLEREREREAKRLEEDQKILNFAIKRTPSREDEDRRGEAADETNAVVATPEPSPKERSAAVELRERRLGKFRYLNKRDKQHDEDSGNGSSPKSVERIIIGHERATTQAERRAEITAALSKKYEGKSREELMLIANGMENEALLQRQRVKELEDYLDNLLLRVMETHPKILQNPYSRTTSAKSG